MLTADLIFSVRNEPKSMRLPKIIQEMISKLRLTPAPYVARIRHTNTRSNNSSSSSNWREQAKDLTYGIKFVKDDDKDCIAILNIINKLAVSNIRKLTDEAVKIIETRDEQFRFHISKMLFDKCMNQTDKDGIHVPMFATLISHLCEAFPEMKEDLLFTISKFSELYSIDSTLLFPKNGDPDYNDKKYAWFKQTDKKRTYAQLIMELTARKVLPEEIVKPIIEEVIKDLNELAKEAKTEETEENVTRCVEFIFEASKVLVSDELKEYLKTNVGEILSVSKDEFKTTYPSVNNKSKFKLMDALDKLNGKK